MSEDRARELLELEYEKLQSGIDKFDDQRFKVKGWAITVVGALLALGLNSREWPVVFVGGMVALFFAYMEVLYMAMQERVIQRSNYVEVLLEETRRGSLDSVQPPYVFGIGKVFEPVFKWPDVGVLLQDRPHITVFYSVLALGMFVGAVAVGVQGGAPEPGVLPDPSPTAPPS